MIPKEEFRFRDDLQSLGSGHPGLLIRTQGLLE